LLDALGDPHLVDLILVPTCYYGSARENDVDWDQFVILFRSIFLEGLAMPGEGIRPFLKLFVDRLKDAGGELRLKSEVARVIVEDGAARGVELTDGTVLEAETVISSAGWVETMNPPTRRRSSPRTTGASRSSRRSAFWTAGRRRFART
jgi:phytoene dehydrogenase-like protein